MIGNDTGRQDVRGSMLVKAPRWPPEPLGRRHPPEARRVLENAVRRLRILLLPLAKHLRRSDRHHRVGCFHATLSGGLSVPVTRSAVVFGNWATPGQVNLAMQFGLSVFPDVG
jgi:hypothetical protein